MPSSFFFPCSLGLWSCGERMRSLRKELHECLPMVAGGRRKGKGT